MKSKWSDSMESKWSDSNDYYMLETVMVTVLSVLWTIISLIMVTVMSYDVLTKLLCLCSLDTNFNLSAQSMSKSYFDNVLKSKVKLKVGHSFYNVHIQ